MDSVIAVEKILKYNFKNKSLLKDALTHRNCKESTSNERLEFLGDSAIALAVTKHLYVMYPNIEPNKLSPLKNANVRNEKFARDALKHGLYQFLRHKSTGLDEKVKFYTEAVSKEDESESGRIGKATKALADLVEAIAGAVFIDVEFDLQRFWMICKVLFEPLVTLEELRPRREPPVFRLKQFCKKHGKALSIRHRKDDTVSIGEVYFDDELFAFAYGEDKSTAKLLAAEKAAGKLPEMVIDENTPKVEPKDAKGELQTGSSSLLTASEVTPKQMVIDEITPEVEPEDAEGELQARSSSLLTVSEVTPKQMVIDENTPEVEPEDAEQARSSSLFTASEVTPKQMVIDSPQVESEDAKGELTTKLHIRNPLIYEMTNEEMVIDEDKPENAKQKLNEICAGNRWPYPIYSLEEEKGLEERYVCTVKIEIPSAKGSFYMKGDNKTTKKYAENSSACHMIRALKSSLMYPHVGDLGPKLSFAETRRLLMQEILKDEKRLQSLGGLRRSKRRKI